MTDELSLPDLDLYRGVVEVATLADVEAGFRDKTFHSETHEEGRPGHPFVGETMLCVEGQRHNEARRRHAPLFRREALEFYETGVIQASIERCLDDLRESTGADGTARADLVQLSREMLCDMAARLIGLGDLSDPDRRREFVRLSLLMAQGVSLPWLTDDPNFTTLQAEAHDAKRQFWSNWVEPAWRERRARVGDAAIRSGEEALDLLGLLAPVPDVTDESVLRDCIMYIVGSIATTVQGVVHTFATLTRWFEAHPERWAERLEHSFLRRASAEGLRLNPPVPSLLRRAVEDRDLLSGLHVDADTVVALHMARANRDGAFGECPNVMDPDRTTAAGVKPYGTSFGGGRHVCIGRPVALPLAVDDASTTQGSMVRMLHALYEAGIEVDPDAPDAAPQSARRDFREFPVVFTSLQRGGS